MGWQYGLWSGIWMDGDGGYGIVFEMGGRYKRAVGLEIGGIVPFLN